MDVVNYISDWDKEPYANTSDNWPGWDAKFKDNPKYKGIINDISKPFVMYGCKTNKCISTTSTIYEWYMYITIEN